jgi:peptidoglycan/LPS O-acetylase OafA/YrhL
LSGRFSLLRFYERRIRRIFPALIVVLCAALVLGWLWMLPVAWLQSGYFDIESAKKPLLHLWSLGIEEQFYLFWPLVLMLAARLRIRLLTRSRWRLDWRRLSSTSR